MTFREYITPLSRCPLCDRPLIIWVTIHGRIRCLGCGTRSAVVIATLTAAGRCTGPCDCAAKAEALNQTALNANLLGAGE